MEYRAGTDQSNEMWCVDGTPAGLCGVDQLVGHGDSGCTGSGALGDALAQPHGRKSRLDRVSSSEVNPMFGRVAVELEQHISVLDDLGDRLGVLGAVVDLEGFDRDLRLVDVLGVVDLLECA